MTEKDLKNRINANNNGSLDMTRWIFSHFKDPGKRCNILELCPGTGQQTKELLKYGIITAVDISPTAIEQYRVPFGNINIIEADITNLYEALNEYTFNTLFDIAFCSYGLYYSKNVQRTLLTIKNNLMRSGKVILCGPYGENNKAIFDMVERAGSPIDPQIKHSCTGFMEADVLPWLIKNYDTVEIHTVVNRVSWKTTNDVMAYLTSTTFYDREKEADIIQLLDDHFARNKTFENQKHIMLVEACNDMSSVSIF